MKYTALYCRVSTSQQSTGLESQARSLKVYCDANEIEDYKLYSDEGISGAKSSRPGLDQLMEAVQKGEISSVIVYSFSRFARSTKHLLSALEIFNQLGVSFVSLSEKLDTSSATGRAIFTIIAAISQLERELTVDRVRNGIANARAKNKQIGRPKTRNADLIKTLIDQGLTYREIAKLAHCSHWAIHQTVKEMAPRSERSVSEVSVQNRLVV